MEHDQERVIEYLVVCGVGVNRQPYPKSGGEEELGPLTDIRFVSRVAAEDGFEVLRAE